MSEITYEDYVEAAKQQGFEIELSEEDFAELSEEQLAELSTATRASYRAKAGADAKSLRKQIGVVNQVKTSDPDVKSAAADAKKDMKRKLNNRVDGMLRSTQKEETEMTEQEIAEGSQAMETLKPNSMPAADPKSRVEIMKSMIGAMAEMPKKDLVKWFDQTQALYGPNKDHGVADNSAKNKSSIDMKPSAAGSKGADVKDAMPKISMKEDIAEMFEGQELSEEFKEKASTLFEAAVSARIIAEVARLEEEYEEKLNEQIESVTAELTEKLDAYLDYVVEQWMTENEVAIETSLRNELMDDFIESLKGVFAEHYIDVPQDRLDVLEALATKVEELEARLDETISENNELKQFAVQVEMEGIFNEVTEGLALTQVERFRSLAEGIEFDGDLSAYTRKLNIIKESHFHEKKTSSMLTESVEEDGIVTEEVAVAPEMKRYMQAISRTVKR